MKLGLILTDHYQKNRQTVYKAICTITPATC